jgi:S-adenosyl-L-methionine methyltransferase
MSRLDIVIRRLEAQRACLNLAAKELHDLPGAVLELGLGNGRSYDHLREILPDREIFVFDREVASHPDCRPDPAHLFLGELSATLPDALSRLPGKAALAHCDLGTWNAEANARLARWLAGALPPLLLDDAFVASDQPLTAAALASVPPPGIDPDRYFLYRHRWR